MKLGEIVANYRKEHEISQRRMADICGVSNGYICYLEKGETKSGGKLIPTIPLLNKLAVGMGMSLNELIDMMDGDEVISLSGDETAKRQKNLKLDDVIEWIENGASKQEKLALLKMLAEKI